MYSASAALICWAIALSHTPCYRSLDCCCIYSRKQAIAKWVTGIAAFFSINNQTSANQARRQLGWKPQTTLSLLENIAQIHKT
jgi:hypothetical protein